MRTEYREHYMHRVPCCTVRSCTSAVAVGTEYHVHCTPCAPCAPCIPSTVRTKYREHYVHCVPCGTMSMHWRCRNRPITMCTIHRAYRASCAPSTIALCAPCTVQRCDRAPTLRRWAQCAVCTKHLCTEIPEYQGLVVRRGTKAPGRPLRNVPTLTAWSTHLVSA